jgi:hypothetical protein
VQAWLLSSLVKCYHCNYSYIPLFALLALKLSRRGFSAMVTALVDELLDTIRAGLGLMVGDDGGIEKKRAW